MANPFDGIDSSICRAISDILPGRFLAILTRSGAVLRTTDATRAAEIAPLLHDAPALPFFASGLHFVAIDDTIVLAADGNPASLRAAARMLQRAAGASASSARDDRLRSLGQAVSNLAHDLNNVLAVIRSMSELLLTDDGDKDDIAVIRDAAAQAAAMTREVLSFAKGADGGPSHRSEVTPLNALVSSFAVVVRAVAGPGVRVDVALHPWTGTVDVDATALKSAMMNLIANARDAGARRIMLRTHAAHDRACIAVEDDGFGMPANVLAHAFDRYFTTKNKGTGLGLAKVRETIEAAGGRVQIDSAPGGGTVVFLELPMTSSPPTVLVAEDDDGTRELIRRVLEQAGFRVVPACDGREALERLSNRASPFVLALLDVRMPHLSGPEVAERLRDVRPELPTLLVSAHLDRGVSAMRKPFSSSELVDAVRKAIS